MQRHVVCFRYMLRSANLVFKQHMADFPVVSNTVVLNGHLLCCERFEHGMIPGFFAEVCCSFTCCWSSAKADCMNIYNKLNLEGEGSFDSHAHIMNILFVILWDSFSASSKQTTHFRRSSTT